MSKNVSLQLTLKVTYKPNGVSVEQLRYYLEQVVENAMSQGLLTGESAAEVVATYKDVTLLPELHPLKYKPKKVKKPKGRFHEGSTQVCAHRVTFFYRLPPRKRISKDELFQMTEAAEERAEECIREGYVQGELNYETDRLQATGWWRIDNE